MAISTFGVTLKYGSGTGGANTNVPIKDFPSILGKRSSLETTTLADDGQTYIQGIRQQGESFDFTANYDGTLYNTLNALTGAQSWELSFSDGSKYTWNGEVSVSINEGSVDAVLEMTISVTPTSVPTWSKGTTTTT